MFMKVKFFQGQSFGCKWQMSQWWKILKGFWDKQSEFQLIDSYNIRDKSSSLRCMLVLGQRNFVVPWT